MCMYLDALSLKSLYFIAGSWCRIAAVAVLNILILKVGIYLLLLLLLVLYIKEIGCGDMHWVRLSNNSLQGGLLWTW
jgi:hypothetical protein